MDAINTQALRILRLFGDNQTRSVKTTVGPEQEYFLVDEKYFWDRKDLVYTGRTLFGSMAPKVRKWKTIILEPLRAEFRSS